LSFISLVIILCFYNHDNFITAYRRLMATYIHHHFNIQVLVRDIDKFHEKEQRYS